MIEAGFASCNLPPEVDFNAQASRKRLHRGNAGAARGFSGIKVIAERFKQEGKAEAKSWQDESADSVQEFRWVVWGVWMKDNEHSENEVEEGERGQMVDSSSARHKDLDFYQSKGYQ